MVASPRGLVASIARFPSNEAWYLPEYSHVRAQATVLDPRAFRQWLSAPRPFIAPAVPARQTRTIPRIRYVPPT